MTPMELIERYQTGDVVLANADILYRIPQTRLVQTFWWQEYDMYPHLPELRKFLNFWKQKLDGPLVQVRVGVIKHFYRRQIVSGSIHTLQ